MPSEQNNIEINTLLKRLEYGPLFPVLKRVEVSIDEIVCVHLGDDGKCIAGVIDEIDGEHFWLRISPDKNSDRYKFSFELDQIVKLN